MLERPWLLNLSRAGWLLFAISKPLSIPRLNTSPLLCLETVPVGICRPGAGLSSKPSWMPNLQTHFSIPAPPLSSRLTPHPASLASLPVCLTQRCQLCITVHREMSIPYADLGLSLSHLDIMSKCERQDSCWPGGSNDNTHHCRALTSKLADRYQ